MEITRAVAFNEDNSLNTPDHAVPPGGWIMVYMAGPGAVNPPVATVDLKKAYDLSFLQKLQDNGFYAKYSIPTK